MHDVDIVGIGKRYGGRSVLRDMTFSLRPGELFGFVGGNGAGKTTTMRIVLGVLAPDAGEVRWHGEPITFESRRRIGYMPEERGLYPKMGVLDQLSHLAELHGLPRRKARAASRYWAGRLGLSERLGDEVGHLSLGNQQRVQLAAALVHDPRLLVLDEPFSGLDPTAVDVMTEALREKAAEGVPVIFSSHQLDLVERICDRVGIISGGRMEACGTIGELRGETAVRLVVDAPDAPADWAGGLDGVRVTRHEGTRTHLELAAGADDQAVLRAALDTGPVHEFAREQPPLSELYRGVVEQRTASTGETAAPATATAPLRSAA
ncbi:ABC transporter ATP-binding protein [Streptomyces sp. NBC_00847]|uniref:ABC transporter ATP-binding protein n=1 Tax=Streptomyces sp. NBC_00847 TaxID=2975850 RepID=UPI00224F5E2E|nr:ATP-binding cassette domain-containing protein [Streptomyces sp. NBC_00847]MCX4882363.1 ATP-binding cassette domain-containing protein [Streptomyces sp. NBC_00847]